MLSPHKGSHTTKLTSFITFFKREVSDSRRHVRRSESPTGCVTAHQDRPVERPDRWYLVGRQEVRRQQGHRGRGEPGMVECGWIPFNDEKQNLDGRDDF